MLTMWRLAVFCAVLAVVNGQTTSVLQSLTESPECRSGPLYPTCLHRSECKHKKARRTLSSGLPSLAVQRGAARAICSRGGSVKGHHAASIFEGTANAGDLPVNTYIEGCTTPPCVLPQLQDVVVNLVFQAPRVMNSMRTLATAYLQGPFGITIPIPYDLGEDSVTCNFLSNTYCPVLREEIVVYTLKMFIESFFTEGTVANIEFRVVDESNVPALCIRVPIRIAPPVAAS